MDWASSMDLQSGGSLAEVDGHIGHYQPYATSQGPSIIFQREVMNAARALCDAINAKCEGIFTEAGASLKDPRPK